MKKQKNKNQGFTLIEALISISILMISVTAPLYLASKSLELANIAKNQIVAFYLAQDAMESVKNIIDTNKREGYSRSENGMLHGDLYNKCTTVAGIQKKCIIDSLSFQIKNYNGQKILYNPNNNTYSYKSGSNVKNSIFSRYVNIEMLGDTTSNIDQVLVTVTLEWKLPGLNKQKYELKSIITDW